MTGTAGFGFFHFCHGKVFAVPEVIDSVVADLARVVVLFQMNGVAEDDRFGVFERKFNVLGFESTGVDCCEHYNCTSEQH
jgi:hypothetical protein